MCSRKRRSVFVGNGQLCWLIITVETGLQRHGTYLRPELVLKVAILLYLIEVLFLLFFSAGPDCSGYSMLVALLSVNFSSAVILEANIGSHWPLRSLRLDDRRVGSSAGRTRAGYVFLKEDVGSREATLDSDVESRMFRDPAEIPGWEMAGVPGSSVPDHNPRSSSTTTSSLRHTNIF